MHRNHIQHVVNTLSGNVDIRDIERLGIDVAVHGISPQQAKNVVGMLTVEGLRIVSCKFNEGAKVVVALSGDVYLCRARRTLEEMLPAMPQKLFQIQ